MKENNQLKAFVAFLFIFSVMMLSQAATAGMYITPSVSGYSPSSGTFSSPAGSFTMNAANDGFVKPAVMNVGGRPVTIPANLRMAANAGAVVTGALKRTPWGAIAGTLAGAWLAEQGIEWINDQWHITDSPYPWSGYENCISAYKAGSCGVVAADIETRFPWGVGWEQDTSVQIPKWGWKHANGSYIATMQAQSTYLPNQRPMTDDDWNALPDPLAALGPELPYAPYLPEGVPVLDPEYAPSTVPLGDPYTRPDGSTAQPMGKVSPAGDGAITLDTYDQPLTDPQGNPIQNPLPQDTQEPDLSECQQHPNTIGCAEFGAIPGPESLTTLQVPVSPTIIPVGGAGSCPADITTSIYGLTWSYQPICDFASAIRPLIIGFAWLAFAYIVAGTVRT